MLRRYIASLRDLTTKGIMKQFAAKHALVYFGPVSARHDDHQLVRGITLSAAHTDNHYSVGTFQGYDVMFVERRNTITFPNRPSMHYKWQIMSIDLKTKNMPHIFIDTNHHDSAFYHHLAITFPKLQHVPVNPEGLAPDAKVLAPLEVYHDVLSLLAPDILRVITQEFKHFDYEIYDDQLFVYATNQTATPVMLADMLRIGVWLADRLAGK